VRLGGGRVVDRAPARGELELVSVEQFAAVVAVTVTVDLLAQESAVLRDLEQQQLPIKQADQRDK
jgi:hypothetical protein